MLISAMAAAAMACSAPAHGVCGAPDPTGSPAAPSSGGPADAPPVAVATDPSPGTVAQPIPPVVPTLSTNAVQDDIVVTAQPHMPGDPLQKLNATSFQATQAVDKAVVRPAALGYRRIVPRPIRDGVRNFLNNITEPVIFLNFLLQLKPGRAAETFGRFAVNSTIGIAGLFDRAKHRPFALPYRPNGFADTMGYYGIKPGPFLFLPLVGPTTVRDLIGLGLDRLVVPLAVGKPFNQPAYSLPTSVASQFDQRAQSDAKLQALHADAGGAYAATRKDYLQARQAEIDALHRRKADAHKP